MQVNETYRNNPFLKKKGVKISWTPEMIEEWIKCRDDVIYFAAKYMKIVHIERGIVPFEMYDYQKNMTKSMIDNRFSIFACARQSGKTSAVCAFVLHYLIFNDDKTIAVLANKAATAKEILGRIKKAYELLPDWLKHGIEDWNKGMVALENGSRVLAAATSSDSIRGFAINCILIDEAAFISNWDEFFTSTFPTISSGKETKVILVSTPNGLNSFWKYWSDALKGPNSSEWNEFYPIKVSWEEVPGRDETWRKQTLAGLNNDLIKFAQEYEVEFAGSSGTLISGGALKNLATQTPILQSEEIKQYIAPDKSRKYVIIADVSRGKGLDYSAAQILDITEMPYKQVCTYRSNLVTPVDYAKELFILSKMYNSATILVEVNDIGAQVADTLWFDYESDNLICTENAGARGKKISTGSGTNIDRGIRTTKTVKAVGCSILKLLIEQQQLIIVDHQTIYELSRFSKKGTSYEAEQGCHDDLVMGLVLFAWLSDQQYFKELTDINTLMKLRDKSDQEIEDQLIPFGYSAGDDSDFDEPEVIDLTINLNDIPDEYRKYLVNF